MTQHLSEPMPIAALALTAAIEPLVHDLQHLVVIPAQHLEIAADTIIIPVPLQLRSQLDK